MIAQQARKNKLLREYEAYKDTKQIKNKQPNETIRFSC